MANPKKRKSRSATRSGRAHLSLKETALDKCPQCGRPKLPHTACSFCGTYKGRQVTKTGVSVKAAKPKVEAKSATKEKKTSKKDK